jgi:4-hydroxy-tetrahydrodipicolinate synthase
MHYKAINDNCSIPIIIYNIPPRSVVDMTVDTMARLFELKNIVGVKDATANLDRVDEQKKKMGNEFIQLSGEDGTALDFNLRGGRGCISVTANVAPKLCSEFQEASLSINNSNLISKAKQINDKLMPLHKALFVESNPSPVKYAASLLKLSTDDVRLPLVRVNENSKEIIKSAMKSANLI